MYCEGSRTTDVKVVSVCLRVSCFHTRSRKKTEEIVTVDTRNTDLEIFYIRVAAIWPAWGVDPGGGVTGDVSPKFGVDGTLIYRIDAPESSACYVHSCRWYCDI